VIRRLLVIGSRGTEFTHDTPVSFETSAITVLDTHVLFKRFMILKVRIDPASVVKGDLRVLAGDCAGTLKLVN
jgi:hypothetical protein